MSPLNLNLLTTFCLVVVLSFSLLSAQNTTGTVTPGTTPACGSSYCGNGRCEPWFGESCANCAYDCGLCPSCDNICGNLRCEAGETACNCAEDCGYCCVDGFCKFPWETASNCPSDCVGTLTGYVVESGNLSAVAGAQVSCMSAYSNTAMSNFPNITTSASGYFNFANTSAGNYTCYATAAGYFPGSVSVNFHAGAANFSVRIVLHPLVGSISGELRDARTGGYLRVVNVSCDTPFSAAGGISTSTIHKFASDTYFFEELPAATFTCTASKSGWFPSTQTVVVSPANNTVANFYLQQRPTYASGYLLDIRTLNTIPGNIYCRSTQGNVTFNYNVNANGFYNVSVTPGYTYLCEGSSPDYLNKTFTLDCNYFRNVSLTPVNCTVNVITIDTTTGARLGNVSLDFRSPNISNLFTDSNGFAQVRTRAFLYSIVVGTKIGYLGDSEIIYCNRTGVANITLYLTPIPNRLTVLVLDQRTGLPITTASVLVQGGNFTARAVNGTGYVEYFPIAPGNNYVAFASAPGYSSNSTVVPPLTYNSSVLVVIYLSELPCTVIVTVYDAGANNSLLSGATVFLLPGSQSFSTDAFGQIPQQNLLSGSVSGYNASKSGYTTASGSINCARNGTVNINIYLTPLPNVITVQVLDADTLLPIPAYMTLSSTGVFTSTVQAMSNGRYTWTPVPAGEYFAFASYTGYNDNSTRVGIVLRNDTLFATILLRIKPCILTVTVEDGTDNTTFPPLDQAVVTIDTSPLFSLTTNSTGTVVFVLNPNTTASNVLGSKAGYSDDFDNFTCSAGANPSVFLVLYPLPNSLTVLVRDIQTNALIPGASVTLNPVNTVRTATTGQLLYTPLPAGTYFATASASGYVTNSSESATLLRNDNKTVTVYLRTLDCVLNVLVEDETNSFAPLSGASVFIDTVPTLTTLTTQADGRVTFNLPFNSTARNVGAFKEGYDTDNDTFTCSRGAVNNVTLVLTALPNTLNVLVRDADTLALISGASVTVMSNITVTNPTRTATSGSLTYTPLPAGSYYATATAAGYGSGTSETAVLVRNDNKTVTVLLATQNCVLNVLVQDGTNPSNLTPLDSASVSVNTSPSASTQTTSASGIVVFNLPYNTTGNSVTGSKSGYSSASGSFTCGRGVVQNVTLILVPLPNSLTVLVRDAQTFQLLSNATVTLLQTLTVQAAANGQTVFSPLASGTYQANGTAPGYNTNTSETATLLRNDNKTVTVWLTQLSCTVIVQVINGQTGAQINGATVTLNNAVYTAQTTNPTTTFIVFSINPANVAFGSATGFLGTGNSSFTCTPGATTLVNITLLPIIEVELVIRSTYTGGDLPAAVTTLNGTRILTAVNSTSSVYRFTVASLPFTASVSVSAPGYTNVTRPTITWTSTRLSNLVTISPTNYEAYFILYETLVDGSNIVFKSNETLTNNLLNFAADIGFPLNQGYYQPVPYAFTGSVTRYQNTSSVSTSITFNSYSSDNQPLSSQASFQPLLSTYLTGAVDTQLSSTSVLSNFTVLSARFPQLSPSSSGQFFVTVTNVTGFYANFGNLVTGPSFSINIPDFNVTIIRRLLIPLPYRRAFGFIDVKFVPYANDGVTLSTFRANNFVTVTFQTSVGTFFSASSSGGASVLSNAQFAILEYGLPFGAVVNSLPVSYQTEEFDENRSGYVNNGVVVPGRQGNTAGLTSFTFPPPSLLTNLFTVGPNGQSLRNPSARLFTLLEYRLFRKTKKRQN